MYRKTYEIAEFIFHTRIYKAYFLKNIFYWNKKIHASYSQCLGNVLFFLLLFFLIVLIDGDQNSAYRIL